ncbi:hypothetical protein OEA41_009590 [Lepraria neglecta]|uniref:Uncharacterized protein n=1 Tax=Lepraria neglecta TaxID=209136 RepID=A0AAD9Z1Y8_9LECA|nr:hypothetical protein OEA41_009590 [Lepraria neglecta]
MEEYVNHNSIAPAALRRLLVFILHYWPTPAPARNVTTVVGADNFTYTSPSVYVVYKGISATNDCGQTLGSTTTSLTVSFAPSDLTTFSNRAAGGYAYVPINYATISSNCTSRYTYSSEYEPPCESTVTASDGDCMAQISAAAVEALDLQDHCYPQFPFPPVTLLQGLNTAWSICDLGNVDTSIIGVFDPPRALAPESALAPPVLTKAPGIPASTPAAPAPQISSPIPAKTAAPSTPLSVSGPDSASPNESPSDPGASEHPGNGNKQCSSGSTELEKFLSPPGQAPDPENGAQAHPANLATDPAKGTGNFPASKPENEGFNADGIVEASNSPQPGLLTGPAHGSEKDPSTQPANPPANGGSKSDQLAQGPASSPTKPTLVAPPTFAIPLSNGEILSGAVIDPSSIVLAGSSAGATVKAGAPAAQVLSHTMSVDPEASSIVVDGQAFALPSLSSSATNNDPATTTPPPPFASTINGHVIQAIQSAHYAILVDEQSIAQGVSTRISNTPVAFHSNGDLVIGTSTIPNIVNSFSPTPPPSLTVFAAAGQSATVLTNGIAIAGTTLTPNAPAFTMSGTRISYGTEGLVVGSSTVVLPTYPPMATITLGSQVFTYPPSALSPATVLVTPLASSKQSTAPSVGESILSGLNSGMESAGSGTSSVAQTNVTGTAGGSETFQGAASKVVVSPGHLMVVTICLWLQQGSR